MIEENEKRFKQDEMLEKGKKLKGRERERSRHDQKKMKRHIIKIQNSSSKKKSVDSLAPPSGSKTNGPQFTAADAQSKMVKSSKRIILKSPNFSIKEAVGSGV